MQAMDMGSAEATMAQIPSIAPPASYYLQLDPSGQVDILESSLVLSKPNMAEETVYEIQLDPYLMDERNVEIINLQNLQGSFAFQPEFLDAHGLQSQQQYTSTVTFDPQPHYTTTVSYEPQQQYTTTVTYEPQPQQLQFHLDDVNFNQMLLGNNNVVTTMPPAPPTCIKEEVVEDDGFVPEFAVETEIVADKVLETSEASANLDTPVPKDQVQFEDSSSEDSQSDEEMAEDLGPLETLKALENDVKKAKPKFKRKKRFLPDNIMGFTEEAVIPPRVELYARPPSKDTCPPSPSPPPVVTVLDEEEEYEIEWNASSEEHKLDPEVPQLIHDGMDPDDELYISFHSRPDSSKTALCVLCYVWFDSQSDLESHLKSTHQDNMKLYGCKRCGKQFWSRFLRQRHEKTHRYDLKGPVQRYFPKNRPYNHYEPKHFLKRLRQAPITPQYREHMRRLHSEIKSMEFECFECNEDFRSEEEYREHYEEEHAVQTCAHCRDTFDNSKLLRKHEQHVHGKISVDKNYTGGAWKLWETSWGDCTELKEKDSRLVNVYLYHNYSKRVKREAKNSSDCDNFENTGCDEITVSSHEATKLMEKRRTKSPDKSRRSSKGSGKSSSKREKSIGKSSHTKANDIKVEPAEADVHMRVTADMLDLPFKCEQCKTAYDTEADLQRHLKTHTIRSMAYMCQYCGRGFATHSNRKEHERIHTGDKPYVCPICSRAFVQISNLKKHIQTHKDKNNLQCSTCQKQFVKESSLILHQRAHSQDRKFRCHICDRAYNYASLLKRHMRIHTGENPYSCEDCGQEFHELVSLHYHRKKVHTGERPHRCVECGRAFILSSDLKKHLKIHERDPSFIKLSNTKTYSRKGKDIPSTSGSPGALEMPMMNPINGDNGMGRVDFENEATLENSVNSENHMDVDYSENDATMKHVVTDDDDDEDERLVINESSETNMLNLSETGVVTTDEQTNNHETNETVENKLHNEVVTAEPLS